MSICLRQKYRRLLTKLFYQFSLRVDYDILYNLIRLLITILNFRHTIIQVRFTTISTQLFVSTNNLEKQYLRDFHLYLYAAIVIQKTFLGFHSRDVQRKFSISKLVMIPMLLLWQNLFNNMCCLCAAIDLVHILRLSAPIIVQLTTLTVAKLPLSTARRVTQHILNL